MNYVDTIEFKQPRTCMYAWVSVYEPPTDKEVEFFGAVRYKDSPILCPFTYVSHLAVVPLSKGRRWSIRVTFTQTVSQPLVIDVMLRDRTGQK